MIWHESSSDFRGDWLKKTTQCGTIEDDYHNKKCEETLGNTPIGAQILVVYGRGTMIVSLIDFVKIEYVLL